MGGFGSDKRFMVECASGLAPKVGSGDFIGLT
jgi:hypothetical protein